eukprot:COSAG01_NODE_66371_length_270_cov_0.877193_2_plen_42_part_01
MPPTTWRTGPRSRTTSIRWVVYNHLKYIAAQVRLVCKLLVKC